MWRVGYGGSNGHMGSTHQHLQIAVPACPPCTVIHTSALAVVPHDATAQSHTQLGVSCIPTRQVEQAAAVVM
jgi:hypothetical protein